MVRSAGGPLASFSSSPAASVSVPPLGGGGTSGGAGEAGRREKDGDGEEDKPDSEEDNKDDRDEKTRTRTILHFSTSHLEPLGERGD